MSIRWITGLTLTSTLLSAVIARFNPFGSEVPQLVGDLILPIMIPLVMVAILVLLWQFHGRLSRSLAQSEQSNRELQLVRAQLEDEVATRTADLSRALAEIEARAAGQARLLEELEQQREVLRELSVPVLPVERQTLVVPLVGALDSQRLQHLQSFVLERVQRSRARRLLIDVTGVPIIDTHVAQSLLHLMQALRLLGAEGVLVGIRPEVAQTLVGLGVDLAAIRSYADLETALAR